MNGWHAATTKSFSLLLNTLITLQSDEEKAGNLLVLTLSPETFTLLRTAQTEVFITDKSVQKNKRRMIEEARQPINDLTAN